MMVTVELILVVGLCKSSGDALDLRFVCFQWQLLEKHDEMSVFYIPTSGGCFE